MTRFGRFKFDFATRRLSRDDEDVHLTPKAFDLLALLIEAAPRVVPKNELHQRLWPNGVVSDATLVGLVKELRRALGDHDERSPVIRTVHRVGYAFDAPVISSDSRPLPKAARWLVAADRRLPLVEGENVIGRDPESNVWLDYATVSRRHARIVVGDEGTLLEDLGSKNGTSIGGIKLTEPASLRDGDRVGFGQIYLTYRETSAALPTVTQVSRLGDRRRL